MLTDGIEEFRKQDVAEVVAKLIARTTRWVDPATFALLPVWAPHTYRKAPLYKVGWLERQINNGQPKHEGNVAASAALTRALGLSAKDRPNWTCCHIWGNDDDKFQSRHAEVNDPRYFSCPANMVLLPSPMKTFTDTLPEVKAVLRIVAFRLYGFVPEGRSVPSMQHAGAFFPPEWRDADPQGILRQNERILSAARQTRDRIGGSLAKAPGNYPAEQVCEVIDYWRKKVSGSLLDDIEKRRI